MIIQSDDDWKAQAQREKEKLAEKAKADAKAKEAQQQAAKAQTAGAVAPSRTARNMGSFSGLLQSLATQSLMMMGAIPDPRSGRAMQDLGYAKALLDSVVMLEEKTRGNLTDEEQNAMFTTLYELRDTYVRAAWMARSTAAA